MQTTISDLQVLIGQDWQNVESLSLPANVQKEIANEIAEGAAFSDDYKASDGRHYRWE